MDTIAYAKFRCDTAEVENGLKRTVTNQKCETIISHAQMTFRPITTVVCLRASKFAQGHVSELTILAFSENDFCTAQCLKKGLKRSTNPFKFTFLSRKTKIPVQKQTEM